jgi:hypothetical protein
MGKPFKIDGPQPAHTPTEQTREIAATLAGLGLPLQSIAASIGVHTSTLNKYYLADMEIGKAKTHAKVANALVINAVDHNNVQAQSLYLKTQMAWSETNKVEHSGAMMVVAPWLSQRRIVDVSDHLDTDEQESHQLPSMQSDAISDTPAGRPVIVRRNPKQVRASRANGKLGGLASAAKRKNAAAHPGAVDPVAPHGDLHIHPPTKNSQNK